MIWRLAKLTEIGKADSRLGKLEYVNSRIQNFGNTWLFDAVLDNSKAL